jgi:hypothetical protein
VRRDGARHVYRIDPKGVDRMRRYLDRLWDKALASFKAVAEANEEQS